MHFTLRPWTYFACFGMAAIMTERRNLKFLVSVISRITNLLEALLEALFTRTLLLGNSFVQFVKLSDLRLRMMTKRMAEE